MASNAYISAMFDSVKADLTKLLVDLPDIPFVDEQAVARSKINSEKGTKMIFQLVQNAVAAGERADAKKTSQPLEKF